MADKQVSPSDKYITNLASKWDEKVRKDISKMVCETYDQDKAGRWKWEEKRNRWYKLWLGQRDKKQTPWPDASNVCLPLLAIACNQFHARSYQSFFAPPSMVKTLPVNENDIVRSRNVEQFMNWQMMEDMEDYEEESDKLLLNVPISGTNFKKVYYDREHERPCADYKSGMNIILPYRTKNLQTARRVTDENWLHYDELKRKNERVRGFFIDFGKVDASAGKEADDDMERTKDDAGTEAHSSEDKPKLILEQHTWYKAPGDDKMEPYIFWVDYDSQTLLRATSRLLDAGNQQVVAQYFVDYHFLPNPEGYYSLGFGHFLEGLNEMANTAFNQIFDAGRISNQPFGFYGRRAGFKRKEIKLHPGRMEEIEDATQVYFPNMQRVDQILFQVLGMIQQYSEQFTSTSDYMMGREAKGVKNPTATGTQAIIEQGLIIYSVMIKRLFRSLKKELKLVYTVDQLHLPETKQFRVMASEDKIAFPTIKRKDFEGKMDVIPYGDPSYASKLTRRQEAQEIYMGLLNNPLVGMSNPQMGPPKDPKAIWNATKAWLETYERKDISKLLPDLPEEMLSPEAENSMFMQGDAHEPIPGEDHMTHLKSHLIFQTTQYFASMEPEYQKLLIKHVEKTKALMYMEQMQKQMMGGGKVPAALAGQPPQGGMNGATEETAGPGMVPGGPAGMGEGQPGNPVLGQTPGPV